MRKSSYADINGRNDVKGRGGSKGAATGLEASFVGFVNFSPSDEQKSEFAKLAATEVLWQDWAKVLAAGLKLTVSWNAKEECYTAFLFERREASPNAGLMVSGRGGAPVDAMLRAVFYVTYCLPAEWARPVVGGGDKW